MVLCTAIVELLACAIACSPVTHSSVVAAALARSAATIGVLLALPADIRPILADVNFPLSSARRLFSAARAFVASEATC